MINIIVNKIKKLIFNLKYFDKNRIKVKPINVIPIGLIKSEIKDNKNNFFKLLFPKYKCLRYIMHIHWKYTSVKILKLNNNKEK